MSGQGLRDAALPALSSEHRQQLARSAIAPEVVAARGYFTAPTKSALAALGFPRSQQQAPALVLPIYNVAGALAFHMIRPDTPRWKDGKALKYELPVGSTMVLDAPHVPWMREAYADPTRPLFITEGPKKVDCLVTLGCAVIGVIGTWAFLGTNEHQAKILLSDWYEVGLTRRRVYLVYDSDVMTKPSVHQALRVLSERLKARDAEVHYIYLPSEGGKKVGVDDFVAAGHDLDAVLALSSPTLKAPPVQTPAAPWQRLDVTKAGKPDYTPYNVQTVLTTHPHWHGRLWLDTVRWRPMLDDRRLENTDAVAMATWLGEHLHMPIRFTALLKEVTHYVCTLDRRDLLSTWLAALPPWNGAREDACLTAWLSLCAGVPDTAYHRDVARLLPVSLVARALHPGCKYRNVIVLEGPQDTGKSELLKALVGREWHAELTQDFDNKETYILMRRAWLAELGELRAMSRTNVDRFKQFVTEEINTWVPKFANLDEEHPRRTILVGTSNNIGQPYWKDETGATRLLPVVCGTLKPELLTANTAWGGTLREQLFAEALHYYLAHPADWWQLSAQAADEVHAERELRIDRSILEAPLAAWLAEQRPDPTQPLGYRWANVTVVTPEEADVFGVPHGTLKTSTVEIAMQFLGLDRKDLTERKGTGDIPRVLRNTGWRQGIKQRRVPGAPDLRERPWFKHP